MEIDDIKRHPDSVRFYLDRVKFRREGKEYKAVCCFHSEKTASLTLFQDGGVWLYKCHGCGVSGNVVQFVERFDKIPFNAALKKCREQLENSWSSQKEKVESTFKSFSEQQDKPLKTYSEGEYARLEKALTESKEAQAWLLKERGITLATAQRLRFGFRQDVGQLAGTTNAASASRGWISFPTFSGGVITSVKYRSITGKFFCKQPGMGTFLYNSEAIDFLEPIFLVEGELDAAILEQYGFRAVSLPNATTKVLPEWKDKLLEAECVILAGDNDGAVGSKLMRDLWNTMRERTYLLEWPVGIKDANQFFLETCKRDEFTFRTKIEELVTTAKSKPMEDVYSLSEAMAISHHTGLSDHPDRLRFPWEVVDKMVVLLPGSVMSLTATNTKQGKTQFVAQLSLNAARKHNEIVLNYQAELSTSEFANIAASHVLKKSRNSITSEDYKTAAKILSGVKYYIGRNATLNTIGPVLELIEAAIRRLGATLIIIDHIHFLCRNQNDEIRIQADAMQKIKNLAVQYKCKFIVVSQPRKAQQIAKGKLLHVTDIKGSETLTSDADAIFALHRNFIKVKDPDNPPLDDYSPETEIHLLGARSKGNGPTFAKLMFIGDICTFSELSHAEPPTNLQFAKD